MDENSKHLVDDCFLRPIADPRSTNVPVTVPSPKLQLKQELKLLYLSDESKKMIMETLKSINGEDFELDNASKYKDKGGKMKKTYWEDRGTLLIQSATNYSIPSSKEPADQTDDRLKKFALVKLENYGFALNHCSEAYDFCEGSIDDALILLYEKYMNITERKSDKLSSNLSVLSKKELLDIRDDERLALESIYDDSFQVKESYKVWSLRFKIEHLLQHSPSKAKKSIDVKLSEKNDCMINEKKGLPKCRNFVRDGKCKFGNKCRFSHIIENITTNEQGGNRAPQQTNKLNDEDNFFLEIRFPDDTKYPYEPPYIFLKTTCHDIPADIRLKISKRLYEEAEEICKDGMPCVYSIGELLQTEQNILKSKTDTGFKFPSPNRSLFFVESYENAEDNNKFSTPLPTHYEKGQTSISDFLKRNSSVVEKENRNILRSFLEKQNDERYKKMIKKRQVLPAFTKMNELVDLINKNQVIVISGETGCGKSTQVPQFILDNWLYEASKQEKKTPMQHLEIICTQPRRLSAIGVSERVAEERVERIGQTIGYQIRLENKISSSTRLTFCTTGILLRKLSSDPLLESVTHVIIDEVHERSEESDFLLMILKHILEFRADLKVILMSATLNAQLFSEYFGGVPVFEIPGRTFPVKQLFLEDILEISDFVMECDSQYSKRISKNEEAEIMREMEYADIKSEIEEPSKKIKDEKLNLAGIYSRYKGYSKKTCKSIYLMEPKTINPELIESILKYIVEGEHDWPKMGTILIFLPGMQEIQIIYDTLQNSQIFGERSDMYMIIPLHSTLSSEDQALIFKPAPKGKRKIVLSTNIAETSITIDDCVFVIDVGLMKEKHFDSNRNMESLELVYVSKANALQRKGRAGRVMPGVCIHLYTSYRFRYSFLAQPIPEIHRVPLEQLVLRIKTLKNLSEQNIIEVLGKTMEPPQTENIIGAVKRLQDVGALDEEQNLTPLGVHLSALPVDVRIGKLMLYGAIFQCLDSVLTIAACLSNKSPFVSPFNKRTEAENAKRQFSTAYSDHLTCLLAYNKWLDVSKRSYLACRNYADENFLSLRTLQTIGEVKYQFLELLVSIGFVPTNIPKRRKNTVDNIKNLTGNDLNVNGSNSRLLIALLCAALYPNIVKIVIPERSYIQTAGGAMPKPLTAKDIRFKTKEDSFVAIHPSSINAENGEFSSPFLIYQEKVKTSRVFIKECSLLHLTPLILFAGSDLRVELHGGDFLFLIEDGWIILKSQNHETAEMMLCLRIELQKILQMKISDPCLNLLNHTNANNIIKTIVYLISNNK